MRIAWRSLTDHYGDSDRVKVVGVQGKTCHAASDALLFTFFQDIIRRVFVGDIKLHLAGKKKEVVETVNMSLVPCRRTCKICVSLRMAMKVRAT